MRRDQNWQPLETKRTRIIAMFRAGWSVRKLAGSYHVGHRLMQRFLMLHCPDYQAVIEAQGRTRQRALHGPKRDASLHLRVTLPPFEPRESKWPVRRIEEFRAEELEALRQRLEAKRLEGWFKPPPTEQESLWLEP